MGLGSVTVTVSLPSVPSVPGSFSVPPASSTGGYTVSWNTSSGTVTAYELYEKNQGGSWSRVHNANSLSVGFNKDANRYFDYKVRACNGSHCSSYTSTKRVTIPNGTVDASTNPSGLAYTTDAFSLNWSSTLTSGCSWSGGSLSGTSGSRTVSLGGWSFNSTGQIYQNSLQVSCSVKGGGTVTRTVNMTALAVPPRPTVNVSWNKSSMYVGQSATFSWNTTDTNSCTLDGGSVGTSGSRSYSYGSTGSKSRTVTCTNAQGSTSNSASISISVDVPGNPSAPSTASDGGYSVTWDASSGSVTRYELYERQSGSSSWNRVHNAISRSVEFNKQHDRYFDYRVRACNNSYCSGYTSTRRVTIPKASINISSSPSQLGRTDSTFTLNWSSVMTSSCSWDAGSISGTSNSKSFRLPYGWSYSGSVWTKSTRMTCQIINGGTVTKDFALSAVTQQPLPSINVSWQSGNRYVGQPVTLEWSSSEANSCRIGSSNVGTSGTRQFTYSSSGSHSETVTCENERGSTNKSSSVSLVYTTPGVPGSIMGPSTTSDGEYTLSWGASSGDLTAYQFQESSNGGSSWSTIYSGNSLNHTLNKNPNANYSYRVRACNNSSCSNYTATKTVTVPASDINASASPSTLSYGTNNVTLSWNSTMVSSCSWSGISASGTSGSHQTVLTNWTHNTSANRWESPLSVTCNKIGGGTVSDSVTVLANNREPAPTINISWDKSSVPLGENALLSWDSTGSDNCEIDNYNVAHEDSRNYSFGSVHTHSKTITCTNLGGTTSQSASIAVEGISIDIPAAVDPADDLPSSGETYYGYVSGNFNVSGGGAATYSLPINVAPGIAGVQPNLSLNYNSDSGNGIAGWGWSVAGLSRIHRCPASKIRDGEFSGTLDGDNFKLCLDGQRLVEVATGEYRTERESNRKIVESGNGYIVYLPNGRELSYGLSDDSRRESANGQDYVDWHLNKVTDLAENYMTYHYEKNSDNGIHRISHIEYTKNDGATSLNHSVEFDYGTTDRADVLQGYWSGIYYQHDKRLENIVVKAGGNTVRNYILNYQDYTSTENADPAKTSRLRSVSVCHGSGSTACSDPVEFEWTSRASSDFGFDEKTILSAGQGDRVPAWQIDFDGDGKNELLYRDGLDYYVAEESEGLTFAADQFQGTLTGTNGTNLTPFDINNDGRDDILVHSAASDSKVRRGLMVSYSTENGFTTPEDFLPISEVGVFEPFQYYDFNGDGFRDILRIVKRDTLVSDYHSNPFEMIRGINVSLNLGNGQFTPFEIRGEFPSFQPGTTKVADMNGDRLPDIVRCQYMEYDNSYDSDQTANRCRFLVALNEGDDGNGGISFADPVLWGTTEVGALSWSRRNDRNGSSPLAEDVMILSDVNGDGLADSVWAAENNVQVALNNGKELEPFDVWLNQNITQRHWQIGVPISIADLNADNYPDLLIADPDQMHSQKLYVAYNESGSGFASLIDLNITAFRRMEDYNNDGVIDLMTNIAATPYYNEMAATGYVNKIQQHRITAFNTRANTIAITYNALNDPTVHTQAETTSELIGATSGEVTLDGGATIDPNDDNLIRASSKAVGTRYLVQRVDVNDGIGGTNNTQYHYSGFLRHRGGWGGLGFAEVEMTSTIGETGEQSRIVSEYTQRLRDNYKAVGLLKTRTRYADDDNGNLQEVSRTQNIWHVQTMTDDIDGYTSPHFRVALDSSHSRSKELNGTTVNHASQYRLGYELDPPAACNTSGVTNFFTNSTGQHSGTDAYGNVHQSVSLVCDGTNTFTTATNNQYENRDGLLGLVINSKVTNTAPDENNNPVSLTREVSATFDTNGFPVTQTREPNSSDLLRTTTFSDYDPYGAPQTITETWNDSEGLDFETRHSKVSVVYQVNGQSTVSAENALGHKSEVVIDGQFGNVLSQKDVGNNLTTYYSYDALGRVDTITAPDGSTVITRYRTCNNCEAPSSYARHYVHTKATGAAAQRTYYDAFNREVGQRMIGLTGIPSYTQTDYNAAGRVDRSSQPFFAGGERFDTVFTYDALGRVRNVRAPNGGNTGTIYNGLQTIVTNALSQTKTTWRNGLGQTDRVQDDNQTEIEYDYDPFGNLTRTEIGGVETVMGYDAIGRQLFLDDPSAGRVEYAYNGLDLMVSSTDAKQQRTTFAYDELGRQITRVDNATASNAANRTHEWFYDTPNSGDGRLGSVEGFDTDGEDYSESYSYNAYGLPTTMETTIQGETYETTTYYDDFNRPASIQYPTGYAVVNEFNSYGYRHQVKDAMSDSVLWTATEADALGNITLSEHGNGIETRAEYSADTGLVESIFAQNSTNSFVAQNQQFSFDVLGNLEWRSDNRANAGLGFMEDFCYDNLNRLTAAREGSCSNSDADATYDDLGNIQSRMIRGQGVQNYTYDSNNPYRLASTNFAGSFGYDANGNITSGDGRTIQYSSFDKPTRMTKDGNVVEITYGSDQSRIKRVDNNSVTTIYVAGIYEKQSEGNQTKHIHYVGDIAIRVWEEENNSLEDAYTSYLHYDHIGSLAAKSNEAGDAAEFMANDAWGMRREESWLGQVLGTSYVPTDTRKGFTGHEHMDGVGLIHMNGRVYDAEIGRFLSADPFVQDRTNLQALNRYSYVQNNPLSYTDPSGYFLKKLKKAFKKAFKAFRKVVRSAFRELKRHVKRNLGLINKVPGLSTVVGIVIAIYCIPCAQAYFQILSALNAAIALANGASIGDVATGFAVGMVTSGIGASIGNAISGVVGSEVAAQYIGGALAGGIAAKATGGKFADGVKGGTLSTAARHAMGEFGKPGKLAGADQEAGEKSKDAYNLTGKEGGLLEGKGLMPKGGFQDGFSANLSQGKGGKYFLAFRGTEPEWGDIFTDIAQAFGFKTSQYRQAETLALAVSAHPDVQGNITFTGHSLGGGLASAAASITGGDAVTFNAAGLHPFVRSGTANSIRSYYIRGDGLSLAQTSLRLPSALGQRISLGGNGGPLARHSSSQF